MASYGSEETWNGEEEEEEEEEQGQQKQQKQKEKKNNVLPIWGNERSMNLNPLILTNIQSSHYFKVDLYELKTYHEVIDEIYYKVQHLEPWEKGSRKTAGQTGMCGGVRGVGAGGIVSTAYCLLYKLFTLKLTRKQVNGLITHQDSPYIRGLGFMYIRYTQPPADLWDWYDAYLEDAEEIDVKAGGGLTMTVGNMLKNFLTKLEWFSTLFPRIPVPIQQKIQKTMAERFPPTAPTQQARPAARQAGSSDADPDKYPKRRDSPAKSRETGRDAGRDLGRDSGRERERFSNDRDRDRDRSSRDNLRDGSSFLRDSYRDRDVKSGRDDRDPYLDRDRDRARDFDRDRRAQRDRGGERERQRRHDPRDDRDRSHRRREGSRDRDRERERRYREYDHSDLRHKSSSYR